MKTKGRVAMALALSGSAHSAGQAESALGSRGTQEREAVYRLDNSDYRIEMIVRFFPPYLGRRLTFSSTRTRGRSCVTRATGILPPASSGSSGLWRQSPTDSSRVGRTCRRRRRFGKW